MGCSFCVGAHLRQWILLSLAPQSAQIAMWWYKSKFTCQNPLLATNRRHSSLIIRNAVSGHNSHFGLLFINVLSGKCTKILCFSNFIPSRPTLFLLDLPLINLTQKRRLTRGIPKALKARYYQDRVTYSVHTFFKTRCAVHTYRIVRPDSWFSSWCSSGSALLAQARNSGFNSPWTAKFFYFSVFLLLYIK